MPNAPQVPSEWPRDRYDLVWAPEGRAGEWAFTQIAQRPLAGDGPV